MRLAIKTIFRHLWRTRLFTILNILGLAIGISTCWIIYRIIDHEFSYDATLPNHEHIYQLISTFSTDKKMAGVGAPLYQGIRAEIPGLEKVVPVFFQSINSATINHETNNQYTIEEPKHIVATDIAYFDMLPYQWLAGNKLTALNATENVVLCESRARAYFPDQTFENILGKTIIYYGMDTVQRTVTGVVASLSTPTEFIAQEFFPLREQAYKLNMWTNTNSSDKLYLQFRPDTDTESTLQLINALETRHWKAFEQEVAKEIKRNKSYELLPIREAHFATNISDYFGTTKMNKNILYGLLGIGIFLLLLACINYINLSIAQIPTRAKEIGVRKTLGSRRRQLISYILFETAIISFFASVLAIFFIHLGFKLLHDIVPIGVASQIELFNFLLFTLVIILLITLCAGLYPSWLITNLNTVNVLKNFHIIVPKGQLSLQKVLIIFQFLITLIFITSTLIVGSQLRYTVQADMGFKKDAIVIIDVPWKYLYDSQFQNKQFTLLNELKNTTGIEQVSLGSIPLSDSYSSSPFQYQPQNKEIQEITMYKKWIDTAYLGVYQMELLAGRNLKASDTVSEYLINESAAKALGFVNPEDAIGKTIAQRGNQHYPIVGVVADFHTQDFYTPITPLVLMSQQMQLYNFNIKLVGQHPEQWQSTLKAINKEWNKFYPAHAFHYRFYDDALEALYKQERQTATLIHLSTSIIIIICCLGLFGLATLTAYQRTKEIGVRKVLGASVSGIIGLLSKDFIKLVAIAFLIASPITWWAMNKWLQDFVYRIDIEWWMFGTAGIAAVVIALLTVSYQAIRAARANPIDSLRDE